MKNSVKTLQFPAQYIEIVETFLRVRGCDVDVCLADIDVDAAQMLAAERMDQTSFQRLLQLCRDVAVPGRPASVQILGHFPVTAHGLFGIVIMTSPTLEAALSSALRFYPVVMPAYEIVREDIADQVHVIFRRKLDIGPVNDMLAELILGSFNSIRRYVDTDIGLFEMHFSHQSSYAKGDYASICDPQKLHFGAGADKIIIPKKHLSYTLSTGSKTTTAQFTDELERQVRALGVEQTVTQKVRDWVRRQLREGKEFTVHDAASAMAMSSRTLSRYLGQEDASYKSIADDERLNYSEFLVLHSQRPLSHIAHMSGFINESSFSRAYRRKKGLSPSEARKACRQG